MMVSGCSGELNIHINTYAQVLMASFDGYKGAFAAAAVGGMRIEGIGYLEVGWVEGRTNILHLPATLIPFHSATRFPPVDGDKFLIFNSSKITVYPSENLAISSGALSSTE